MKLQEKIINVFGQIRVYSLIDLALFALAIGSKKFELLGIILLHIGFLFYLEHKHKHTYRVQIPSVIWVAFCVLGIIFYDKLSAIGFLLFGFLYAKKNSKNFSPLSSLFRGMQYYFLAAGILGFLSPISFLAFGLLTIRSFAGDLRDVTKDRKEKMRTLPIVLGFKKDIKTLHIILLMLTSLIWLVLSGSSLLWLIPVYILQIITYNITPR